MPLVHVSIGIMSTRTRDPSRNFTAPTSQPRSRQLAGWQSTVEVVDETVVVVVVVVVVLASTFVKD